MEKVKKRLRISTRLGLALGGGGARGAAHIGILTAFAEKKIPISCISGTSAGAFVGALFAFGKSPREIDRIFASMSFSKISNLMPVRLGLSGNQGVANLLIDALGNVRIEDAEIPLGIVCTDLLTGRTVVFTEGPLAKIVQASCSFPGIFSPVEYDGMVLVDGAISENVPVAAARSLGANFVVAVSLSGQNTNADAPNGMIELMGRCFDILVDHVSQQYLKDAEYIIHLDLSFMSRFRLQNKEQAIALGYAEAKRLLGRSLLYWWSKPFVDYIGGLIRSLSQFLETALTHPHIRAAAFFSQSFAKRLKDRVWRVD